MRNISQRSAHSEHSLTYTAGWLTSERVNRCLPAEESGMLSVSLTSTVNSSGDKALT